MGMCGGRRKNLEVRPEQKWDYINLSDFKSNSGFTVAAYIYLYISILISLAVYGVDSFTAVSLLAFGKWTSSIDPNTIIDFTIQKWIFSICIIASFVNLGFEHIRAWRVMRRGSVAESYLDNLAVKMESTRMGSGQGWRRFLVFADLTKSKKGAEYVALFTYFSFQSWIRVIFCSGPRQFVNALTLYAVFESELIPTDGGSADRTIMNFFEKIGALANESYQQAAVLSGMVFTLVIWVFSALSLLLAAMFYVFFLWHYIPKQDGGLSGYCARKINKRLMKVVSVKVNKAIKKEEESRARAELKAAKKAGLDKPPVRQQATLPTIPNLDAKKDDYGMPPLSRNDTMATLPVYTSRPPSPGGIEMNALEKRPMPSRAGTNNTMASQSSYSSRAPLMASAAGMGYQPAPSPVPSLPPLDVNNYPPPRPGTSQSTRNYGPGPGLQRVQTGASSNFGATYSQSPTVYHPQPMPAMPPPTRALTSNMDNYGRPGPGGQFGPRPAPPGRSTFDDGMYGRASPAPSAFNGPGPRPGPQGKPTLPFLDEGMRASPAPSAFNGPGPRPGPPGRPTLPMLDDGMGGRASPAPSMFSNAPGPRAGPMREPTLPMFDDDGMSAPRPGPSGVPTLPNMEMDGMGAPRPGPPRVPTLPRFDDDFGGRSSPAPSMFSNAPGPRAGPSGAPTLPSFDEDFGGRASPAPSAFSNAPGALRKPTLPNLDDGYNGRSSPAPSAFSAYRPAAPGRTLSDESMGGRGSPAPSILSNGPGRAIIDGGMNGRASPAPSTFSSRGPAANRSEFNGPPTSPRRSATGQVYSPNRPQFALQRNMTAPLSPSPRADDYVGRPGTSASTRTAPVGIPRSTPGYSYNEDVESQRGPQQWR
ncbi:Potassium transporter [Pestalotiopsis sp. IQ-011]